MLHSFKLTFMRRYYFVLNMYNFTVFLTGLDYFGVHLTKYIHIIFAKRSAEAGARGHF